jgi:hypothetical protein
MSKFDRRRFLRVLAGAGAGAAVARMGGPVLEALAMTPETEYFIFIMADGGWDVTLWSDPRNEAMGLINPATTDNVGIGGIPAPELWKPSGNTFTPFKPSDFVASAGNSPFTFGPGVGRLVDHYDRLCLVNGINMNTVAHLDGKAFSCTGSHLSGVQAVASSVDTIMTNELGVEQILPNVSIGFPSTYVGANLDPRASPLVVDTLGTINASLYRTTLYDSKAERDLVTLGLADEANDLKALADDPRSFQAMALHYGAVKRIYDQKVDTIFNAATLLQQQPSLFDYNGYNLSYYADSAADAAFAVQAMSKDLVRCVNFSFFGFDTHAVNYQSHLHRLQEAMGVVSKLLVALDNTPHPNLMGEKLSDHTHILMVSDFCRTPNINLNHGRDHYPNNSAMVISPRFQKNFLYGQTDPGSLLPTVPDATKNDFTDGPRPISPPDLLRTFVSAFGIDPAKYLRDGQVVPKLLRAT